MRPKEVSDRLQLDKIAKDHVWKVEPSCATTGEGIFEGLVRSDLTLLAHSPTNIFTRPGSPTTSSYHPAPNKRPYSDPRIPVPLSQILSAIPERLACSSLHIPGFSLSLFS